MEIISCEVSIRLHDTVAETTRDDLRGNDFTLAIPKSNAPTLHAVFPDPCRVVNRKKQNDAKDHEMARTSDSNL